jgi:hypothetical protein
MSEALPFALLAVFVVLLAAMPWRRPHLNHQFMLELLRLLEEDEQTTSWDSSLTHPQPTPTEQLRPISSSESNDSAGRGRRID